MNNSKHLPKIEALIAFGLFLYLPMHSLLASANYYLWLWYAQWTPLIEWIPHLAIPISCLLPFLILKNFYYDNLRWHRFARLCLIITIALFLIKQTMSIVNLSLPTYWQFVYTIFSKTIGFLTLCLYALNAQRQEIKKLPIKNRGKSAFYVFCCFFMPCSSLVISNFFGFSKTQPINAISLAELWLNPLSLDPEDALTAILANPIIDVFLSLLFASGIIHFLYRQIDTVDNKLFTVGERLTQFTGSIFLTIISLLTSLFLIVHLNLLGWFSFFFAAMVSTVVGYIVVSSFIRGLFIIGFIMVLLSIHLKKPESGE